MKQKGKTLVLQLGSLIIYSAYSKGPKFENGVASKPVHLLISPVIAAVL